eukprot:TRINITY_DN10263_c0_g1_i1.p1 TRINITY_DN10263_c0_g1~~TRINITY_DN10263_c0_g1_i1.p1  ORF type:complete len:411 (+),score=103.19 TRINITY_DN10263_c0_g1_i1:227-1459(+)
MWLATMSLRAFLRLTTYFEGITSLTLTNTKAPFGHRRNASWAHAELPSIMYEDDDGGDEDGTPVPTRQDEEDKALLKVSGESSLRTRSYSDGAVTERPKQPKQKEKTLAYWKLEKELRLAKDTLLLKVEQCQTLEQYKEKLTAELDDLATSVFEEAHEMVRVEKEARFLSDKRWKEAHTQNEVLLAEVAALKAVVEHAMQTQAKPGKHATVSKGSKPRRSFRWRSNEHHLPRMRSRSSDDLLQAEAVAVHKDHVEATVDVCELEALGQWREANYNYEHDWMLARLETDIKPCLATACQDASMHEQLLKCIQNNTLVIEDHVSAEEQCQLSKAKAECNFRMKLSPKDESELVICERTRNQLVALCNLFTYTRYLQKGLVTGEEDTVLLKLKRLLFGVQQARLLGTLPAAAN